MEKTNIRLYKKETDYGIIFLGIKKVYINRYIKEMSKIELQLLALVVQITILIMHKY